MGPFRHFQLTTENVSEKKRADAGKLTSFKYIFSRRGQTLGKPRRLPDNKVYYTGVRVRVQYILIYLDEIAIFSTKRVYSPFINWLYLFGGVQGAHTSHFEAVYVQSYIASILN